MRTVMVVIAFVVAAFPVAGRSWTPPRTPWGDPDLQGFWPSAEMLGVPFERPSSLGWHKPRLLRPCRHGQDLKPKP